jgi:hypothetical protein
LYNLQQNLDELDDWDGKNVDKLILLKTQNEKKKEVMNIINRQKSNTKEIISVYHNEGLKFIPKDLLKRIKKDTYIRLSYLSSFPYLLTLLVDLEQHFSELKNFFISLNEESFFEKIGLLSETKLKNKKRIHR